MVILVGHFDQIGMNNDEISKIFLDTKDEIVKGYRFKPTFISSKLNNILITKGFESIKIGV